MKQEKQQEIALMRYGAIAPIIAGPVSYTHLDVYKRQSEDGSSEKTRLLFCIYKALLPQQLPLLPLP